LHWVKGIDDLIETAFLLKQAKIDFEWQVIGGVDTEDAERYLYHVFQKGLKNEVKFLGKQTHQQTIEFIKTADIYVQTSLSEGFCNAVLEAQVLGKLCVAYHSGGIPENIIDKKTGFIVTKGKPQLLVKKIKEVLDLSETEKHQIQKNSQLRVQNENNLEKQKMEFNNFYN
jgi:colanic acid/amylovoran biosynthesis glycosyltransferase